MAVFINYNGVHFNAEEAAAKSVKEFIEHEKHHGCTPDQYKEIHALCGGKKSVEKKEAPAPEDEK